jgi:CRP/FNR family transcriptional regulator
MELLQHHFPYLEPELVQTLAREAQITSFSKGTQLLREGQNVTLVPLVLEGMLRVFSRNEDKELLLYYLSPGESCMLSFTAGLRRETSRIYAEVEEPATLLLLPTRMLEAWLKSYPSLNTLYFNQYQHRYEDLVDTIRQLVFNKMDGRVLEYLQQKIQLSGQPIIKISHRAMANDLGTAREVITRVIHKLEKEGLVVQTADGIVVKR